MTTNVAYAEVYEGTTNRSWYIGGLTYSYADSKAMLDTLKRSGWIYDNNKWYYFGNNGIALNKPLRQNGTVYYFKSNGEWLEPNSIDFNTYKSYVEQIDFAIKHKMTNSSIRIDGFDVADYANLVESYMVMYFDGICVDPSLLGISINKDEIEIHYVNSIDSLIDNICIVKGLIDSIINEAKTKATKEEQIRFLNDVLLDTFDYDYTLQNKNRDYLMAYLNGNKIICFGYAGIFKDLCDRLDIECSIVAGKTQYGLHCWNKVTMINGEEKYVDVCWNETALTRESYLLLNKEEIARDHFEDITVKLASY